MKRSTMMWVLAGGLSVAMSIGAASAASPRKGVKQPADAKPRFDMDTIMKKGFKKGGLLDKIKQHDASKADMAQFVDYTKALIDHKPTKGEPDSWKSKTTHLYNTALAVQKGDESKLNELFEAANCKACHNAHKED